MIAPVLLSAFASYLVLSTVSRTVSRLAANSIIEKRRKREKIAKEPENRKRYLEAQHQHDALLKTQQQGLDIQESILNTYIQLEQSRAEREKRALELQQAHLDWLTGKQVAQINYDHLPRELSSNILRSTVFGTQPTVVIYNDMANEKLVLYFYNCGLQTIFFDWGAKKKQLNADGMNEKQSLQQIQQEIIHAYQLLAVFSSDVYCLSINPLHEPHLFQLPPTVKTQEFESCFVTLRQFQEQRRAVYEEEQQIIYPESAVKPPPLGVEI